MLLWLKGLEGLGFWTSRRGLSRGQWDFDFLLSVLSSMALGAFTVWGAWGLEVTIQSGL